MFVTDPSTLLFFLIITDILSAQLFFKVCYFPMHKGYKAQLLLGLSILTCGAGKILTLKIVFLKW